MQKIKQIISLVLIAMPIILISVTWNQCPYPKCQFDVFLTLLGIISMSIGLVIASTNSIETDENIVKKWLKEKNAGD